MSSDYRTILKGIAWGIVVAAIVVYFVHSHLQKKAKEKAERAEQKRIEQQIRAEVSQMVTSFNAIDDWEVKLSKGEQVRVDRILTIELEKLWLTDRPILFTGTITDIATHDADTYLIRIERGLFSSAESFFFTQLALELRSKKERIDTLLNTYPNLTSSVTFDNNVAVIAKVTRIKTAFYSGEEGAQEEMRIGIGDCLGLVYIGSIIF